MHDNAGKKGKAGQDGTGIKNMIRYAVLGSGSSANSYIIQYEPGSEEERKDSSQLELKLPEGKTGDTGIRSFSASSEVNDSRITIVIDNGFSLREFTKRAAEQGFNPEDIDFIFLTHDHSDHLKGISTLSSKYSIPVVMCKDTVLGSDHKNKIYKSLVVEDGKDYSYSSLNFSVFRTFHDSEGSVGYSFNIKGKIFTIITDTGIITEEMEKYALASDVLFLEANYCPDMLYAGPYPWFLKNRIASDHGHLSNYDAVGFLEKLKESGIRKRKIYLCHLSDKNNCPDRLESVIKESFGEEPEIDYRICRKGETVAGIPVNII